MVQEEQNGPPGEQVPSRARIANVIAQQIIYNCCSGSHHISKFTNNRHNIDLETPFPLYMGPEVHGDGRQKKHINNANSFDISVS